MKTFIEFRDELVLPFQFPVFLLGDFEILRRNIVGGSMKSEEGLLLIIFEVSDDTAATFAVFNTIFEV